MLTWCDRKDVEYIISIARNNRLLTLSKELIKKSFEFLLERESKESILSSFDLPVISRYFPEYERVIKT